MDLHALADFNLVATHGGFGRASRASGRSKATLSRKVTELEEALGARLIERGTRSLRLTEEGQALHDRTQGPLGDIAEAGLAVGSDAAVPRGRLRISAPVVLSHVALARIAADFVAAYPEVELEIVAEDRRADPVEDNFDVVIRIDPHPDDRLAGRRIARDERLLVARPEMAPGEGGEIAAVALVAMPPGTLWTVEGRTFTPVARLRLSSFLMVREAVLAGAGFALVPKLMVEGDIAAGRLISFGVADGPGVEIWALQNSRRLASTRIRLFIEALVKAFI